jgi:hypothetical protein
VRERRPGRATAPRAGAAARPAPVGAARLAAGLVVLALVAGCGGGDEPRPQPTETPGSPAERPEPSDEAQIADLVRDRAAALEAGDRRAYVATATGAQRRRDRVAVRRAARQPLTDVTLDAGRVRVSGTNATSSVATAYGIAGIQGTFRSARRVDAVRTADGWRISGVSGRRGLPPWEVATFEPRRSRHFVVLAPPAVSVDELIAALETGYRTMRGLLSRDLRRRYLVLVAGDAAQARALTTGIRGVGALAALSDASVVQEGAAERTVRVISLRLLVVWPAFASLDAAGRTRVVTHELTHAALTASTSGRTPAWLSEGVALYVSGDRRPAPPGADLGSLSQPDAIARLSGPAQSRAYDVSSAAAFAIADRFGHRRLLALYDAFNNPRLRGRPSRRLVDRALRRTLGMSLDELEGSIS